MNKTMVLLSVLFLLGGGMIHSQDLNNGFSTGGLVVMETNNTGGAGELGFSLLEMGDFTIRNHILLTGFGYESGGVLALGNKILLGGFTDRGMRSYGFVEAHAGIFKTDGKDFFELPLYYDLKGGGGVDIYTSQSMSFFVELGGALSLYGEETTGAAHLAAGFRTFWY